jgi:subtilisin family serine protease
MANVRTYGANSGQSVRDYVLLKFKKGTSLGERESALEKVGGTIEGSFGFDGREYVHRARLSNELSAERAADALASDVAVTYAEPDFVVHAAVVSNDPGFTGGKMWGMAGDTSTSPNAYGSQAAETWAAGYTGSTKVAVGVIDSGVDYTHQDLYQNIWLNNNEIPTAIRSSLVDTDKDGIVTFRDLNAAANATYVRDLNLNGRIDAGDLLADVRWEDGLDTDLNGYRDDLIGWDFANNDNDPYDDEGHGTHVSGTIAATGGNGVGVAGVAWSTLIVPLKFLDAEGSGMTSAAVRAIDYFTAAAKRSTVVDFIATNNSWGGGGYSQSVLDAIIRGARQDILFVAAAGNGGDDGIGDNNDYVANFPLNYSTGAALGWEAMIGVAALTSAGALASYSNYGAGYVEIGAPGSGIYSTLAGGGYGYMSGTSMATPHVTGALALIAAASGGSAAELRSELMSSAAATPSLAGKTITGGRLDTMAFLQSSGTPVAVTPPPPAPTPTPTPAPSTSNIYGTIGSDMITGTTGNNKIWGVPAGGTSLGRGTVDTLRGNGGNDVFVLGDARGRFYDDGRSLSSGSTDYAKIMDFNAGDKLQVRGAADDYWLRPITAGGTSGTGVYYDTNNNHVFDSRDELIGVVGSGAAVTAANLLFV